MNHTPKVSVIIPTHNRALLTVRAVRSVLNQTTKDFELIVIDDGSTESYDELNALVGGHPARIVSQTHQGVSAARNHGARIARAPWLAFLDSDDEWLPTKLARQIEFHQNYPDCKISHTGERWIRNGERVNAPAHYQPAQGEAFHDALKVCCIGPSSVMICAELFKTLGGFDQSLRACEDYDLWLRVTAHNWVGLIPEQLILKYGGHADQLSRTVEALDLYRVQALLKLLLWSELPPHYREATRVEAQNRLIILAKGATKRGLPSASLYGAIYDTFTEVELSNPLIIKQIAALSTLCVNPA